MLRTFSYLILVEQASLAYVFDLLYFYNDDEELVFVGCDSNLEWKKNSDLLPNDLLFHAIVWL